MLFLKRNLPLAERAVRLALALALAACAVLLVPAGVARWLAGAAAAGLALTALAGFCPACALAGRRIVKR
jgi:hypothetical protein